MVYQGQVLKTNNTYNFIAKYDENGNYKWIKPSLLLNIENVGNKLRGYGAYLNSQIAINGNTYYKSDGKIFLEADVNGGIVNVTQVKLGGGDFPRCFKRDKDNNLFVTGHFSDLFWLNKDTSMVPYYTDGANGFDQDIYLIKYDKDLKLKWAVQAGSPAYQVTGQNSQTYWQGGIDYSNSVVNDIEGSSYITGSYTYEFHIGDTVLHSLYSPAMFIAKYDANGKFKWAMNSQGLGGDAGSKLAINNNELYYLGVSSQNNTYGGFPTQEGLVLGKLKLPAMAQEVKNIVGQVDPNFFVYPNPSSGFITIKYSDVKIIVGEIRIENVLGQLIYSKKINTSGVALNENIDLSGYSKGIYFVQINTGGATEVKKIILE